MYREPFSLSWPKKRPELQVTFAAYHATPSLSAFLPGREDTPLPSSLEGHTAHAVWLEEGAQKNV